MVNASASRHMQQSESRGRLLMLQTSFEFELAQGAICDSSRKRRLPRELEPGVLRHKRTDRVPTSNAVSDG